MQLLLLRHADAEPLAATDAERRLTEKGERQAERVARFLKTTGLIPELLLTSPFTRASQTAQAVGKTLEIEPVTASFLASGMRPEQALGELAAYANFQRVIIVGHEPDFSLLASALLGASSSLHIRKAALVGLEVQSLRTGGAILDFSIPVKWMNA